MGISLSILGMMRFGQPWWLWAMMAAAVPLILALRAQRRGWKIGRWSVAAQSLALILLALALAQPEAPLGPGARRPLAVFHDISPSTRGQHEQAISMASDLPRVDYVFSQDVAVAPGNIRDAAAADKSAWTQASPPLRLASGQAQGLAGAVLISDGQWHDDWPPAAQAWAQTHLGLWIVPLESPPPDARVSQFHVRRGSDGKADLAVTVESNAPMRRRLTVSRDGVNQPLAQSNLTLLPGQPSTIHISDNPPATSVVVYRAALDAADTFPENDRATQDLWPLERRVLVLTPSPQPAWFAGVAARVANTQWLDASAAPADASEYAAYAAVILVDPTGKSLALAARGALARYVRDGGGLVLAGTGPCASPADRDDPLNQVAALVANPYQRTPLRLVVVLDASGSMGEDNQAKFNQAREASLSLQRHLTPRDSLRVITYSLTPSDLYDSGAKPPDFAALRKALAGVSPAGGTKVMPALELAAGAKPPKDCQGLVLLVSDLLTEPFEPAQAAELAGAEKLFRDNGYRLEIVATQAQGDTQPAETTLDRLAGDLKAQFVRRKGLAGLAEVFEQFLQQSRGEPIARGQFNAKLLPPFADNPWPELDAYIPAAAQEGASVFGSIGADPIVGVRPIGLGRTISLAIPALGQDNRSLTQSPSWPATLGEAVRMVQRPEQDPRFSGSTRRNGEKLIVTLDARDTAGPMNLLQLTVQLAVLDASASAAIPSATMTQVAPGKYEARLPASSTAHSISVRDAAGRLVWRDAIGPSYDQEFATIGVNMEDLRRLAELTGGKIIRRQDLADLAPRLVSQQIHPLWPYLLAAGLLIMLLDWCLSRVLRTA